MLWIIIGCAMIAMLYFVGITYSYHCLKGDVKFYRQKWKEAEEDVMNLDNHMFDIQCSLDTYCATISTRYKKHLKFRKQDLKAIAEIANRVSKINYSRI